MTVAEFVEAHDLVEMGIFDSDPYCHFTGLLLPRLMVERDQHEAESRINAALQLEAANLDAHKRKWEEYKQARKFMPEFWRWLWDTIKAEYDRTVTPEMREDEDHTERAALHIRIANTYISDHKEGEEVRPEQFTKRIPWALRHRATEDFYFIEEFEKRIFRLCPTKQGFLRIGREDEHRVVINSDGTCEMRD